VFDSHCHLTDLEDAEDAILAAQQAGVGSMLTCGYSIASNRAELSLRSRVPDLAVALGLHPWNADEDVNVVLDMIERHTPEVIGEIGLDLWGETPVHPLARQMEVLEAQLQLAVKLGLAVTLHSRKAIDALLAALRNHPGVRGALHAWSGSYEQLRPFLELGMYLGIGGAITRSRARRLQRVAAAAPLDRILIETDAPAIGMDIVQPPHVRPAHVIRVAAAVAQVRGIEVSELEARTDENASRLFGERVLLRPRVITRDGDGPCGARAAAAPRAGRSPPCSDR
jgi:TatD DNase family protein